jgi:hypothetical protein
MSILWSDDGDLRLRSHPRVRAFDGATKSWRSIWSRYPLVGRRSSRRPFCVNVTILILAAMTILLACAAMAGAEERPPAAGIAWSGPRLTPAEAARIMAQAPGMANVANWPPAWPEGGPAAVIIGGRPGDGPFGALAAPRIRPACCDLYVNGWPVIGGRYGSGIRGPILGPGHGAKGRRER